MYMSWLLCLLVLMVLLVLLRMLLVVVWCFTLGLVGVLLFGVYYTLFGLGLFWIWIVVYVVITVFVCYLFVVALFLSDRGLVMYCWFV